MSTTAIVPTTESLPAEPKKKVRQLPKKRRCYLTVTPPSELHRKSSGYTVAVSERLEDNLSRWHIRDVANIDRAQNLEGLYTILGAITLAGTVSLPALLWVIGLGLTGIAALGGKLLFILAAVLGIFGGGIAGHHIAKRIHGGAYERRRARLVDGRREESDQIRDGVETLVQMAADPRLGTDGLPVESVFAALDHKDLTVRQLAARIVAELPEALQTQAVNRFKGNLTVEALRAFSGMEWLTPKQAATMDICQRRMPDDLEAYEWNLGGTDAPPKLGE